MKSFLFLILLSLPFIVFSQNQFNENGLPIGHWEITNYNKYTRAGTYILVSLDTIDVISDSDIHCGLDCTNTFEIRLKNATVEMKVKFQKENIISVKNGLWTITDSLGKIANQTFWQSGICLWEKHFDKNGQLKYHDYENLENDISYEDTYLDGEVFSRSFKDPTNWDEETNIYYPDAPIGFSKGALNFKVNFLYQPVDTQFLEIFSREKAVNIKAITSLADDIRIFHRDGKTFQGNYNIKSKDVLSLMFIYQPHSSKSSLKEKLIVETDEGTYPLFLFTESKHIDYKNAEKLSTIELSQSKDKFLIIERLGTVTDIYIYDYDEYYDEESEIYHEFMMKKHSKIDLEKFYVGEFLLFIPSCDIGGRMKLIITE